MHWIQYQAYLFPSRKNLQKSPSHPKPPPKIWDSVQVSVCFCSEFSIQSLWNVCKANSVGHSHGRARASYTGLPNQSRPLAQQVNRKPDRPCCSRTARCTPDFSDFTFDFQRTRVGEWVSVLGLKKVAGKEWLGQLCPPRMTGCCKVPKDIHAGLSDETQDCGRPRPVWDSSWKPGEIQHHISNSTAWMHLGNDLDSLLASYNDL